MATSTPYDDVFRTLLNDCSELILPVLNEAFGEHYTGTERIEFLPNEHFLPHEDGDAEKRITDSCFTVTSEESGQPKRYHIESQSTEDNTMLIRIFEYDTQIALDSGNVDGNTLTVRFPHTAILYLRHTRNTPDAMTIRMIVPNGQISYKVPVLKVQSYDAEELFRKNLLFLIPFHLFVYEKHFDEYEKDAGKLQRLEANYGNIMKELEALQNAGKISEFTKRAIIDMAKEVVRHLAKKHETVKEGVESIMGGKILNYEAKDILNKGRAEGRFEGRIDNLLQNVRALMKKTGWDKNEAMDTLDVTPHDRAIISPRL